MNKESLIRQAATLASQFREAKHVAAVQQLPELLEKVMQHRAADPASLPDLIAALLACQERRDWTGMADYLSYELPTVLGSTPQALAA
ncbi:MAG TPA: hypothetical protein DD979_00835 [Gammaproteobacteria bacterium]|nr:hypothetical protein [Gammaproteobacteria bacterium]